MLKVRNFLPGDLALLNVQPDQMGEISTLTQQDLMAKPVGFAQTICLGARPIACGGIAPLWAGRHQAWGFFSSMRGGDWGRLIRLLKMGMDVWENDPTAYRIEATCRCNFPAAGRLMQHLGFHNETPNGMPGYSGSETYDLYARIKP